MLRWRSRCQAGDDGDHGVALVMQIKSTRWWPYHVTYFDCMWCFSFIHLIFLSTTVGSWDDASLKFQGISVLPEYAPCQSSSWRDTTWWSGVISSRFIYNGCKPVLHTQNTRVKLDEPSICRYGLGTLETERSSVNHIVDMINIEMFTIENYSISRDDRTWFSWYGSRDHLDD